MFHFPLRLALHLVGLLASFSTIVSATSDSYGIATRKMNSTAEFSTGTKSSLRAPRSLVSSFSTPPQVDAKTFNSFVFLEDLVRASGPQEGHAADIFSRSSSSTVTMMMHSIDASKPTDLLDQPGMEEMLTPAFDLVRKYIAEYTSQEEADEVSDADILAVFMPSKNEDEDNDRSLVLKGSQQERSLTTNTACLGDMIDVITEAIAMIMVLFGLASVARPIGRALAKSLKSRSLKAIWEIVQRLGKNKGAGELAEAVAEIFLLAFSNIGTSAFLDAVFDNVAWYEWALVFVTVAAQLAALVVTAGASIALQVLASGASIALFGLAVNDAVDSCSGSGGPEACPVPDGYVFFENRDSAGNDIQKQLFGVFFSAIVCNNEGSRCKGFNTAGWIKSTVRTIDTWSSPSGDCVGLYVKEDVDICETDVAGFDFHPGYDSAGNDVTFSGCKQDPKIEAALTCVAGWARDGECDWQHWSQMVSECKVIQAGIDNLLIDVVKDGMCTWPNWTSGVYQPLRQVLPDCNGPPRRPVWELRNACNALRVLKIDCVGFNVGGWLKTYIQPTDVWSRPTGKCVGMYVRKDTDLCRTVAGYDFYNNYDSAGFDIENRGGENVAQLAQRCNQLGSSCEGFNRGGWIKSKIRSFDWWSYPSSLCYGLYVKQGIDICPMVDGYDFHPDRDSPGSDLDLGLGTACKKDPKVREAMDCVALYAQDGICDWANWTPMYIDCKLSAAGIDEILVEIVKNGDCTWPNWSQGVFGPVFDILPTCRAQRPWTELPVVKELEEACDALNFVGIPCEGFNHNGVLKQSIRPENEWAIVSRDICKGLYVKQQTSQTADPSSAPSVVPSPLPSLMPSLFPSPAPVAVPEPIASSCPCDQSSFLVRRICRLFNRRRCS